MVFTCLRLVTAMTAFNILPSVNGTLSPVAEHCIDQALEKQLQETDEVY